VDRHLETVEFAAHHCVGGAAAVVCYVSRQEDEAHRIGELLIDFVHNRCEACLILLTGFGHMEIAKSEPS
jgi:hypothetical protein